MGMQRLGRLLLQNPRCAWEALLLLLLLLLPWPAPAKGRWHLCSVHGRRAPGVCLNHDSPPCTPSARGPPQVCQVTLPASGGRLLIGSDGLWDAVHPKTAAHHTRDMPAAEAAHRLLALAIKKDRLKDDVTGGWGGVGDTGRAVPAVCLGCRNDASRPARGVPAGAEKCAPKTH